jgi:hypothetical protein
MRALIRNPMVLTLAVTVIGWVWVAAGERALTYAQLSQFKQQIDLLQDREESTAQGLARIQIAMIELQTDVKWIRAELEHKRARWERINP